MSNLTNYYNNYIDTIVKLLRNEKMFLMQEQVKELVPFSS